MPILQAAVQAGKVSQSDAAELTDTYIWSQAQLLLYEAAAQQGMIIDPIDIDVGLDHYRILEDLTSNILLTNSEREKAMADALCGKKAIFIHGTYHGASIERQIKAYRGSAIFYDVYPSQEYYQSWSRNAAALNVRPSHMSHCVILPNEMMRNKFLNQLFRVIAKESAKPLSLAQSALMSPDRLFQQQPPSIPGVNVDSTAISRVLFSPNNAGTTGNDAVLNTALMTAVLRKEGIFGKNYHSPEWPLSREQKWQIDKEISMMLPKDDFPAAASQPNF